MWEVGTWYEHSWASKRGSTHIKELYKCDPHRVSAKKVEDAVLAEVEKLLKQKSIAQSIIEEARQLYKKQGEKSEIRELKRKIAGYKSRIDGLIERISDLPVDISADKFYEKMRNIKRDQEKAEVELKEAIKNDKQSEEMPASLDDYKGYLELIKSIFGDFGGVSPEWKSKLVNRLIHRVEIGRDDLKIHFFAGDDKIAMGIRMLHQTDFMCENLDNITSTGMNAGKGDLASSGTSRDFFRGVVRRP